MPLTPLDIQKARFPQKVRGYDTREVEDYLAIVAEELATRVAQVDRLERENKYYRQRLDEADQREHQLQQTLVRAQKVAEDITAASKREAELLVKEAELTADKVVQQALEQTARIEGKIQELRTARREVQLKLKHTLELFGSILEADMDDERSTATVRTLPRRKAPSAGQS
jgi:cell division initiation protein